MPIARVIESKNGTYYSLQREHDLQLPSSMYYATKLTCWMLD